jgi:MFS transporter, DHA1 family, inner membrane transport protein
MSESAARWALLFGNFVIGTGVLAPAGLINQLSAAFAVDAATAGSLIAYGAALLFVEAPLLAFVTNRMDRRALLTGALVLYAAGHVASGFASSFTLLLIARLVMIGGAAVFTPQAASAIGLFVHLERRASAVAFIFLGWSFALAIGVPLVSLIGARTGWATAYFILGAASALAACVVFASVPHGLIAPAMSPAAWSKLLTSKPVLLLLAVTTIFVSGQFTAYPFVAAELKSRLGADPDLIAILFAVYGLAGVAGSVVSAAAIGKLGAPRSISYALIAVSLGLVLWGGSGTSLAVAAIGLFLWGAGAGPAISAQQARLIAANPAVSSASVAMNSSVLYAGQALGTALGGYLLASGRLTGLAFIGVVLVCIALAMSLLVQRRFAL